MSRLAIILGALLAICAITPAPAAELASPHCSSERQCAGMWAAARTWVVDNCEMKIETMSDSYIETHNSIEGRSWCRVWRDPDPAGGFVFHARITYGGLFSSKHVAQMAQSLQAALNAAADTFK